MKLKELRLSKGITQESIAEYCGVSISAVSQWESEKTMPSARSLFLLTEILKCSIRDIVPEAFKRE